MSTLANSMALLGNQSNKKCQIYNKTPLQQAQGDTFRQAQGDNRCQAELVEATSQLKLPKTLRQTV
ncbi:hypothetical protein, partial [Lacihabitans soyangensis]|uniref:hypothetical protein n=1 Tax=Lacihabitans soyangensis TaxID=869394 RepID=UPI0020CFE24B